MNKIGKTPIIRLKNFEKTNNLCTNIYAKLEYLNPFGSIKDRAALKIIEEAKLNSNSCILEATSGNMGISLAAICRIKGYPCKIIMPENMSSKRRELIEKYDAELILTPKNLGMSGSIKVANELISKNPHYYYSDQFHNYASVIAHQNHTAPEIDNQLKGRVDVIIAGIGTGATIRGVYEYFKIKNNKVEIIGILPSDSPHNIQGIGAGFTPPLLCNNCVNHIIKVTDREAFREKQLILQSDNLYVGISSGAVIAGVKKLLKKKTYKDKNIVLIFADGGDRY